jgi:anti-sigma regulatory factor (Ser/Thr protein kinase)
MTDSVRLEVPATLWSLPTIRMVIGGVGARCDLSLDELQDVYLAVEEVFCAAIDLDQNERYAVEVDVLDDTIRIAAGTFASAELRQRLVAKPSSPESLDLCQLLRRVLDTFSVEGAEGAYSVVLVKQRQARV